MYDIRRPLTILLAEDDDDDDLIIRRACERSAEGHDIRRVTDGVELLDYLRNDGRYADPATHPRPQLILLDLNLPRLDGREALALIKADAELRAIPVVVLTTSADQRDIAQMYDLGANSFLTKPASLQELDELVDALRGFWFDVARLPSASAPMGRTG